MFGWRGWVRRVGTEELSVKSAGCPWISSVVTQAHAPWRSFRQLSRTRPAAVLNSSLQRPTPDEQLQHTGQFPYKPSLPPCSPSLTPLLRMPPGILTALMNITPFYPPQTQTAECWMMRCPWWVLAAVPLNHKEKRAPVKDTNACQTLAYVCFYQLDENEIFYILSMENISLYYVKTDVRIRMEQTYHF